MTPLEKIQAALERDAKLRVERARHREHTEKQDCCAVCWEDSEGYGIHERRYPCPTAIALDAAISLDSCLRIAVVALDEIRNPNGPNELETAVSALAQIAALLPALPDEEAPRG